MFNYIAKKAGYKAQEFTNRKMLMKFIQLGYSIEVYKNGKKVYTMCPVDSKDQK